VGINPAFPEPAPSVPSGTAATRRLRVVGIAALVFALDQLSKWIIAATIPTGEALVVTPFFQLVSVYNPGAAFSFLAGAAGWQRWFFLAIALAVTLWLLWEAGTATRKTLLTAYGMIVGGALGNAWDRVAHGAVHDFLLFHYRAWHWPAFNLADSAITLGVALLLWHLRKDR